MFKIRIFKNMLLILSRRSYHFSISPVSNSPLFLKTVRYSVNIYPILILAEEFYPLCFILKISEMCVVIFNHLSFGVLIQVKIYFTSLLRHRINFRNHCSENIS